MAGDASTLNSSAPGRFRDRIVGIAVLCWIAFWTALGWIDRPEEEPLSEILTVASGAAVTGFGAVGICRRLRCGVGPALSVTVVAASTHAPALASLMAYVIGSRVDLSASPYRLMTEWRVVWLLWSVAAGLGNSLIYSRGSRRLAHLVTLLPLLFAGLYVLWAERQASPWKSAPSDPWLPAPLTQTLNADLMLQGYLSRDLSDVFGLTSRDTLLTAKDSGQAGAPGLQAILRDGAFLERLADQLRPRAVQVSRSEKQETPRDVRRFTRTRFAEEALHRKGEALWKAGHFPEGARLMSSAQVLGRHAPCFGFDRDADPAVDPIATYEASPIRALRLAEFLQSRLGQADGDTLRSLRADLIEIIRAGVHPPDAAAFEGECRELVGRARRGLANPSFSVPLARQVMEFFFPWERVLEDYQGYFGAAEEQKPPVPRFVAVGAIPWLCEFDGWRRFQVLTDWANTEAPLRLLCLGITLELKRREQPDFNPNLAPSAIGVPDFVLRDPLSGQAFRFARIDGKWEPYSIGLDRRDDTGPGGVRNRYSDNVIFGRLGKKTARMAF